MVVEPGGELRLVEVPLELAGDGERDLAGLLGDDEGERVGLLADPERRAVARAVLLRELGVGGQREKAGGGRDALRLDDDGAVVQRSVRGEDADQQVEREPGVEGDAVLDVVAQALLALEDDQRPGPALGQGRRSEHDVVQEASALRGAAPKKGPRPKLASARRISG